MIVTLIVFFIKLTIAFGIERVKLLAEVVYKYLGCGDLRKGFARIKCKDCKHEVLLAFSCKGLYFRPFIRKVYETDPLICPKCQGEMRIISLIDQHEVIKKNLQHLGLWEKSHAPPQSEPPRKEMKEITFDPSDGSMSSPSPGLSRDSQLI